MYTKVIAIMYIITGLSIDYNSESGGARMEKFVIDKTDRKMSSISRTIRMKEETFDRINEINRQTGVSFNKIVNQCIEYALAHYDDE